MSYHARTTRLALLLAAGLLVIPGATAGSDTRAVETAAPVRYIGNGTPSSCTAGKVVRAVAQGGVIRFRCGPKPVTIKMTATAKVRNDRPSVVLDGGGKVTLDGMGRRRVLYLNTCDPKQVWTTPHCQNQAKPTLTVQNLTFRNGRSVGRGTQDGGGAIFVRGGRLKVLNSKFYRNRCAPTGPDVAGGAIQVFSQFRGLPVIVANSTFGGPKGLGNRCSNGGAIGSIGVSWTIINSRFAGNTATGRGANPPKSGLPGGGNGGAIYNDGNTMTLKLQRSRVVSNRSNGEGGSGIFFVSNDRSGSVRITNSMLRNNRGDGFKTHPGIFFLGRQITFAKSSIK